MPSPPVRTNRPRRMRAAARGGRRARAVGRRGGSCGFVGRGTGGFFVFGQRGAAASRIRVAGRVEEGVGDHDLRVPPAAPVVLAAAVGRAQPQALDPQVARRRDQRLQEAAPVAAAARRASRSAASARSRRGRGGVAVRCRSAPPPPAAAPPTRRRGRSAWPVRGSAASRPGEARVPVSRRARSAAAKAGRPSAESSAANVAAADRASADSADHAHSDAAGQSTRPAGSTSSSVWRSNLALTAAPRPSASASAGVAVMRKLDRPRRPPASWPAAATTSPRRATAPPSPARSASPEACASRPSSKIFGLREVGPRTGGTARRVGSPASVCVAKSSRRGRRGGGRAALALAAAGHAVGLDLQPPADVGRPAGTRCSGQRRRRTTAAAPPRAPPRPQRCNGSPATAARTAVTSKSKRASRPAGRPSAALRVGRRARPAPAVPRDTSASGGSPASTFAAPATAHSPSPSVVVCRARPNLCLGQQRQRAAPATQSRNSTRGGASPRTSCRYSSTSAGSAASVAQEVGRPPHCRPITSASSPCCQTITTSTSRPRPACPASASSASGDDARHPHARGRQRLDRVAAARRRPSPTPIAPARRFPRTSAAKSSAATGSFSSKRYSIASPPARAAAGPSVEMPPHSQLPRRQRQHQPHRPTCPPADSAATSDVRPPAAPARAARRCPAAKRPPSGVQQHRPRHGRLGRRLWSRLGPRFGGHLHGHGCPRSGTVSVTRRPL